jgi:trehalose/maltose hydrolase-like predicted phosphorylase
VIITLTSTPRYRTDPQRLAAAEAIAADLGYAGAKYPLESAATGAEQMWTSAKYGWEELEETGCVAWALEQQYWQSGDAAWLRASAPALLKIAAFFASRIVRLDEGGDVIRHSRALFYK